MLLALTLLACGAPDDTGADRLDLSTEVDSVLGDYHLALALAPDPPVVGPQVGVISLTRNVDSAALAGCVAEAWRRGVMLPFKDVGGRGA